MDDCSVEVDYVAAGGLPCFDLASKVNVSLAREDEWCTIVGEVLLPWLVIFVEHSIVDVVFVDQVVDAVEFVAGFLPSWRRFKFPHAVMVVAETSMAGTNHIEERPLDYGSSLLGRFLQHTLQFLGCVDKVPS